MTFIDISEVLGNLGEFIGAFGVMASLIYVGLQIKMTRNVVMADAHSSIAQTSREMYRSIAEHPHLAELISRESDDRDADELMTQSFWVAVFMRLEDTYVKFEYGLVEPHAMRQVMATARSFGTGSALQAWTRYKDRFSDGFVSYVESAIADVNF